MIFAFLMLLTATAGGGAITFLYDDDAPLIVRVAAGAVIGTALVGLAGFLLALVFGLNAATVGAATVLSASPLIIFRRDDLRRRLQNDLLLFSDAMRTFFTEFSVSRAITVLIYGALIVILTFFFDRSMLEMGGGIGTGAVNNLGDLPFHLLVINGFVYGQNFPPDNPIYSGVVFTYPFITDLVAAMMNVAGASVRDAMLSQNLILIIALIVLLARFTNQLTNSAEAALLAPLLLLFNGGLGFLLFFSDAVAAEHGLLRHFFSLSADYTIRGGTLWRWGNSLTILFTTQRTLLLGLPVALIVLTKLWEIFSARSDSAENRKQPDEAINRPKQNVFGLDFFTKRSASFLVVGLLAGMLPLIHAHTFAVVMGVAAILFVLSWQQWREWLWFFLAAGLIAIPELLFATAGSANEAQSFLGWELGWDNGDENAVWFWFVNTGFFIPLLALALGRLVSLASSEKRAALAETVDASRARRLLLFYAPFILCFVIPNLVRLAPWVWDNIKVLIYWYVASIPLVAWLLAEMWRRSQVARWLAAALTITLILSGALDVIRIATRQVEHQILPPQMTVIAAQLRERTDPRSLMLTAPEYASVPVLTGRRWFLGYTGHVWSHGIAPGEREQAARSIYAGGDGARTLIERNGIDYVLVGPQERKFAKVNDAFFQTYPIIAEVGEFRVYQVGER